MKKVLIIDDSETNLFLIKSIFENDPGIEVCIEKDSTKALDLIHSLNPDLLILDLMMPRIDGFYLLDRIKSAPDLSNMPIFVLSALTNLSSIKRAMNFNIVDYIEKPINLKTIEKKIRQVLQIEKAERV